MTSEAREPEHSGVMYADYARGREDKLYLNYRYRVRAEVAVQSFLTLQPGARQARVLELGAAEGRTLLQMRELLGRRGAEFLGIELSEELLEVAVPMPSNARLIRGDVTALPEELEEESFDLVTALAVLEHLPRPQDCVDEAFRMLRPGGVFVATCPNPFWDEIAGRFGMVADEHHEVEVDKELLAKLARIAGFARVRTRDFMWVLTGALPYVGLQLSPKLSLSIDAMVERLGLMNFSFVNQVLVAQKAA